MSVATIAINQLESRLPKVIDARKHGMIDYCHAAFLGMAYVCRKSEPRAALAALITGSFVLVESLLTDYPLGIKKVIPFKVHGQMDAAFAASSFYGAPSLRILRLSGSFYLQRQRLCRSCGRRRYRFQQ